MTDSISTFLIIMLASAIVGTTALLLVSNELGRRAGLGYPGRLMLAGFLGFGIFAVAIKVTIVFYLDTVRPDLAQSPPPQHSQSASAPVTVARAPQPARPFNINSFKNWRALPMAAPFPSNNPTTSKKVALGKKLFFDPALSADGTISCSSCHRLQDGGDDNASSSTGIDAQLGNLNAPSVFNTAFLSHLFWDGRAHSLEDQAKGPLVNPIEMGMDSLFEVEENVRAVPAYAESFNSVFGGPNPVSIDNIVKAIAAFERTLITPDTAYDRFIRGNDAALTPQQLRGMALFQEVGCRNCHVDPTFSSAGLIRQQGVFRPFPVFDGNALVEKYNLLIEGKPHIWRVPSLRNVAITAPYFHNGAVHTLEEAIRIMAVSQLNKVLSDHPADDMRVSASLVGDTELARQLTITYNRAVSEREIEDIAAFLRSLTAIPTE